MWHAYEANIVFRIVYILCRVPISKLHYVDSIPLFISLRSIFHLASHFEYLHADYRYLFLLYTPTSLKACIRCFTWFLLSTASMASQTIICCFWYFCILWYLLIVHQFFFLNVFSSGIYSRFLYRNVSSSFVSLLMSNTQLALVLPWHPLLVFTTYFLSWLGLSGFHFAIWGCPC